MSLQNIDLHVEKSTNLYDNVVGHAMGWAPDGQRTFFDINDETVQYEVSNILVNIDQGYYDVQKHALCEVTYIYDDGFTIVYDIPPLNGSFLSYTVFNPYTVFNQWKKVINEAPHGPYPSDTTLNTNTSPFIMESSKDRFQNTIVNFFFFVFIR